MSRADNCSPSDFYEIMDMLDKRLNDKGKNWRHVLKSLKVLDYCLHEGSELVVTWARKNIYIIKTLREFTYIDEDGRDVGQNVRISAKELTSLILDEDRLRSERSDRKLWKTRVSGIDEYAPQAISGPPPQARPRRRSGQLDDNDAEFRLALEASKYEDEERRKRESQTALPARDEDDDLQKAIKLSKEEEELRRRQLEDQNAASLFDDTPAPSQPQPTGYNQGYQQQPAVDWFGNPLQQQQPQSTGFLNNQYAQPTGYQNGYGFQQQPTGFPSNSTGFDQMGTQPFLQQQSTIQPQQTAFQNNNPYGQQQNDVFGMQSPQPQQQSLQPGTNNPWASNANQADSLKPMPTGSNNPFAQKAQQSMQSQSPFRTNTQPSLGTLYESQPTTAFQQPSQPNPISTFQAPQQQQQPKQELDPQRARLNALLASGEGQDTFGNTGDMRIPAQHTAPGTFVNSAGGGMDRLRAAQTGTNPFFTQQTTGYAQNQSGFGQQMPAQTGPAGGFGGGFGQQSNPFGSRPNQQSGSLIDL